MRHRTRNCHNKAVPDRTYLGKRQCRVCLGIIGPEVRRAPQPLPEPEPEMVERAEAMTLAASIWRREPLLTNNEMYMRLETALEPENVSMPAYSTWMSGWATEARQLSGTPPLAGRQPS